MHALSTFILHFFEFYFQNSNFKNSANQEGLLLNSATSGSCIITQLIFISKIRMPEDPIEINKFRIFNQIQRIGLALESEEMCICL